MARVEKDTHDVTVRTEGLVCACAGGGRRGAAAAQPHLRPAFPSKQVGAHHKSQREPLCGALRPRQPRLSPDSRATLRRPAHQARAGLCAQLTRFYRHSPLWQPANMLARRVALVAPARARNCAFLTKMKAMEAETSKLATTLPDGLKEIAESGVRLRTLSNRANPRCAQLFFAARSNVEWSPRLVQTEIQASLRAFAADRPELFKAAVAKIAEVSRPRLRTAVGGGPPLSAALWRRVRKRRRRRRCAARRGGGGGDRRAAPPGGDGGAVPVCSDGGGGSARSDAHESHTRVAALPRSRRLTRRASSRRPTWRATRRRASTPRRAPSCTR
jgi:hypothetical protein